MARVTLAISCRNTRALTLASVRLLRMLYSELPILVHDDASDDGTLRALKALRRKGRLLRVLTHAGPRIGHGPSMNRLMEEAQTEYVLLLDSDTIVLSRGLVFAMAATLDAHPMAYGCGRVLRTLPRCGNVIYLAPWFAMVRKAVWEVYPRFEHGIAPLRLAMEAIAARGISERLLIDIEALEPDAARQRPTRNVLRYDHSQHLGAFHAEQLTCQQERVAW